MEPVNAIFKRIGRSQPWGDRTIRWVSSGGGHFLVLRDEFDVYIFVCFSHCWHPSAMRNQQNFPNSPSNEKDGHRIRTFVPRFSKTHFMCEEHGHEKKIMNGPNCTKYIVVVGACDMRTGSSAAGAVVFLCVERWKIGTTSVKHWFTLYLPVNRKSCAYKSFCGPTG